MNKNKLFESRVLSGQNRLSAKEKEAIFASVLSEKQDREHRSLFRKSVWVPVAAAASAVFAVGLFVLIQSPNKNTSAPIDEPAFVARGAGTGKPVAKVHCVNESDSKQCVRGSKMIFEVHSPWDDSYFAAFSTIENSGSSVWYYPQDLTKKSTHLKNVASDGILSESGVIGENHQQGSHTLYGIFSQKPLSRQEIKALFEDGVPESGGNIAISKSEFEVTARK